MPPPTYIDITAVPFSRTVTQVEFNTGLFGGVANEVWFRYIAAAPVGLGSFTDEGGTFIANATVYESDGTTVVGFTHTSANFSWNEFLQSAGTYYIKIVRQGGGATDFDFTSQFDIRPLDGFTLPIDSIIINDDTSGNPASVSTIDGQVSGYLTGIPSGEIGALLPRPVNMSLWWDVNGDKGTQYYAVLVDAEGNFVSSIDVGYTLGLGGLIFCASDSYFYVYSQRDGTVRSVSDTGVVVGPIATLPPANPRDVSAVGVTADGSVMYWANGKASSGTQTITAHDLLTDTDLGAIWTLGSTANYSIGVTANGHPGEILVQSDGSLVTYYFDETNQPTSEIMTVVHLSAAGAVLQTWTYDDSIDPFPKIDHIARTSSASTVYLWLQDENLERGTISVLTLATGVLDPSFETDHFEDRENFTHDSDTLFAPSESCTLLAFYTAGGGGGDEDGTIGPIAWMEWKRAIP